jgi:MFS transporter, Spinster family, sphingosine-1-phosphate transporter
MQIILKMDPKNVFMTFAFVCITAPVFGVLCGGYLIQKLGGYTDNRALDACFYISILAAISGIFLPLIDYIPLFGLLIWLLLFFGGSIVPGLTGILISSTTNRMKEVANSITHLCYNLLGYLPSPVLYGLICKYTGGAESRYGLAFILCWSVFGVFFLYLAKMQRKKLINNSIPLFDYEANEPQNAERRKTINANALGALYGRLSTRNNIE